MSYINRKLLMMNDLSRDDTVPMGVIYMPLDKNGNTKYLSETYARDGVEYFKAAADSDNFTSMGTFPDGNPIGLSFYINPDFDGKIASYALGGSTGTVTSSTGGTSTPFLFLNNSDSEWEAFFTNVRSVNGIVALPSSYKGKPLTRIAHYAFIVFQGLPNKPAELRTKFKHIFTHDGSNKIYFLLPDCIEGIYGLNTGGGYAKFVNIPKNLKELGPNNDGLFTDVVGKLKIPRTVAELRKLSFGSGYSELYFLHEPSDTIKMPTAGSSTGAFYTKNARQVNIYTDNETIKNYDWATDNVTATLYHLNGSLWE